MTLHFRTTLRGSLAIAGLASLALGQTANAAVVPTFFDTGVATNNGTSGGPGTNTAIGGVDAHYSVFASIPTAQNNPPAAPLAPIGTVGASTFVLNPATYPGNLYTPVPGAQYISPAANAQAAASTFFDYRITFNLLGFDPSTASLTGAVAADDVIVEAFLNGNLVFGPIAPSFDPVIPFTFSSGFIFGVNTLDFIVFNSNLNSGGGLNATGFALGGQPRASGAILTATPVPEPGSVALLFGMGMTGAGFFARRRRRK